MASLNGVEIKALKTFAGHEGEEVFQGTVYYKGRKLGFWSQSAYGGCDSYDFDISLLNNPFYMWKSSLKGHKFYNYIDMDSFLMIVVALADIEKSYKKLNKNGNECLVIGFSPVDGTWSGLGCKNKKEAEKKLPMIKLKLMQICLKDDLEYLKTGIILHLSQLDMVIGNETEGKKEQSRIETEQKEKVGYMNKEEIRKKQDLEDRISKSRFEVEDIGENHVIIRDKKTKCVTNVSLFDYSSVINALLDLFPNK